MTGGELVLLIFTGLVAGIANTVAGGGTFISYPVLVGLGVPPVSANVTSAVGLISGYAGGSISYRRELHGQGSRFRRLLPSAVVGAVTGATLLLSTPSTVFSTIVPYLVIGASGMLIVQLYVKEYLKGRERPDPTEGSLRLAESIAVQIGILFTAIYATYFGAGLGVVLLAVLGALIVDDLQRLNGLRTLLALTMKCIGVGIFLLSGQVDWRAAAVLSVTAYLGGSMGANITRRMPETVLRTTVIACGLAVGVLLLMS